MQRLALSAGLLALSAALALPAVAEAPVGWQLGSGVTGSFTVLRAVTSRVALAGGSDGALVQTVDGGQTWSDATPPSAVGLHDIASADGRTIFALDTRGAVQRSTDVGVTWSTLALPGGVRPSALTAFGNGRLLLVARRSLLYSSDDGDSFTSVTPKLARPDAFAAVDRAGSALVASGPHALLASTDGARSWHHLRLPPLARGDSLLSVDFVAPRTGFVLSSFRRLYRTSDAGHHWGELLGTGGAGADIAFADAKHGWIAAPGFANRFDGIVLRTSDGGASWRPQSVSMRFLSDVAAAGSTGYAIGDEGASLYATADGGESGRPVTVGFRPVPRVARRGGVVRIRGRIAPGRSGVGVAVSMRSAGRWIVRYVRTTSKGVFQARFKPQRRAWFVAQLPTASGHGSAATRPVFVRVAR